MKLFAIREVSEITGIKPVTLRAWQRRYGLIQPERTESGHRLYTEANLEKIKLIQSWLVKGVSIGKIKDLIDSDIDINEESDGKMLSEVDELLSALATLNKSKAESLITMVMKEYPLDIVKAQFFYPVLERIERVKASQRSLQKALLQSLMISKASSMIEAENRAFKKGKALMVNLDNVGSLPAWFSALELSDKGYNITFLDGVDELSGLAEIVNKLKLDLVYIYSNRGLSAKLSDGIKQLKEQVSVDFEVSELIQKMQAS